MQVDLKQFEVWDGWSKYISAISAPLEKLISKVAFTAIDEVINQNLEGPKKGYNTENATTDAAFMWALDDLKSKSTKLDNSFNFEYYLPTRTGLEGIKVEIDFYQLPEGLFKDFTKLAILSLDDLSEHQWVLGK